MAQIGMLGKEEKTGMFSKQAMSPDQGSILNEVNSLSTRMRIIEEKHTNIDRKLQVVEQNMLSKDKHLTAEIKTINSEIIELRREISSLSNQIKLFVNEIQSFAKKEDVKVLEKYIHMWEPINHITEKDAERIVRRILEQEKESKDET